MMTEEDFGPKYPDLGAGVAKHRRAAARGLRELTREQRHAYGEAVERAIRAKQRSELQRELPSHPPGCASGTAHPDGEAIHAALRRQQRAAVLAWPGQIRRARTPEQWKELYEAAMAEKHGSEPQREAAE